MSVDENKRYVGFGWPCAHCCATGTEPQDLAGTWRLAPKKCSKGCDDGFVKFIGYHADKDLPVKRGDRVRIRKGTLVKTIYHGERLAGRTYVVTVNHTLCGMVHDGRVENPKVVWPGPGGYWSEADINDVELYNPDAVKVGK